MTSTATRRATPGTAPRLAGTAGGLASTASQVGGSIGLAVLATATGYGVVFLSAAGLGATVAALSLLLPRH